MYYLFILKKSLIFKKHKPLIIHDLREVWYPIQKGGIHMPKMQQCINLTSIEKINSFEHTCYSVELNEKIIQIIKKSSGKYTIQHPFHSVLLNQMPPALLTQSTNNILKLSLMTST